MSTPGPCYNGCVELLFIRHGQTASNTIDALDTAFPGAPLNEVGLTQAATVPATWEQFGCGVPDAIVASPLTRTRQTAAPLSRHVGVPVRADWRLREIQAGALEMLYRPDAPAAYLAVIASWLAGDTDRRMPGGETGRQVVGRVDALLRSLEREFGEDARIGLVTHGALTRCFTASRVDGISRDLVMSQPIRNCTLTRVHGTPATGWTGDLYSSRPPAEWEVVKAATAFRRSIQVIGE